MHNKVRNQTQPIQGDFPANILSGAKIIFANCNIIERQHTAGAKAPILRVIDTRKKVTDGKLSLTSSTTHKTFTELQLKKLVLKSVKDVYVELVTHTGNYVPFVGTGRVVLTLKLRNF